VRINLYPYLNTWHCNGHVELCIYIISTNTRRPIPTQTKGNEREMVGRNSMGGEIKYQKEKPKTCFDQ